MALSQHQRSGSESPHGGCQLEDIGDVVVLVGRVLFRVRRWHRMLTAKGHQDSSTKSRILFKMFKHIVLGLLYTLYHAKNSSMATQTFFSWPLILDWFLLVGISFCINRACCNLQPAPATMRVLCRRTSQSYVTYSSLYTTCTRIHKNQQHLKASRDKPCKHFSPEPNWITLKKSGVPQPHRVDHLGHRGHRSSLMNFVAFGKPKLSFTCMVISLKDEILKPPSVCISWGVWVKKNLGPGAHRFWSFDDIRSSDRLWASRFTFIHPWVGVHILHWSSPEITVSTVEQRKRVAGENEEHVRDAQGNLVELYLIHW